VLKADRIGEEYEVHLEPHADPYAVMRDIVGRTDLRRIELRQPTLEDIFITLVEDAHRNEFGELEVEAA